MFTAEEKKIRHRKAALEHYRRNAGAIKARKREAYRARMNAMTDEDHLDAGREASLRYYWKHRDKILVSRMEARRRARK